MKKTLKLLPLFGLVIFLTMACTEDEDAGLNIDDGLAMDLESNYSEENEFLKEVSLLVGNALASKEVRNEVETKIEEADKLNEIVSLSYLLETKTGANRRELKNWSFKSKSNKNLFSNALLTELVNNSVEYKTIEKLIDVNNIQLGSSKTDDIPDDLAELLASEYLEIYRPYEGDSEASKIGDKYYVTFRPIEFVESNEIFEYSPSNSKSTTLRSVGLADNDFVDNNNVYILGRMDECDRQNAKCDYKDLIAHGGGDPDPLPNGGPKLLTYNVDHTSVEEKDIVSTRLAGYKINGNDWLGFGATHQKFEVWRGSPDGKITIKGGSIEAESKSYKIDYYRIRAKGARKGWWYETNDEFDDDWNMSENEQAITVFTKHHLKASAEVKLTTKAGLKVEDGKIKPTAEATLSSEVKVEVGAAKQRTKAQLSRRQVLSTIVGEGLTGDTFTDGGNKWNVKKSSKFHYYFKHYYTDL